MIKLIYIATNIVIFRVMSYCLGFDYFQFGLSIAEKSRFGNGNFILKSSSNVTVSVFQE